MCSRVITLILKAIRVTRSYPAYHWSRVCHPGHFYRECRPNRAHRAHRLFHRILVDRCRLWVLWCQDDRVVRGVPSVPPIPGYLVDPAHLVDLGFRERQEGPVDSTLRMNGKSSRLHRTETQGDGTRSEEHRGKV